MYVILFMTRVTAFLLFSPSLLLPIQSLLIKCLTRPNTVKMPKRKRDYDEDLAHILAEAGATDRATDRDFEIQISQYKAQFDLTLKNLASALKLARGFERQKLGRRQKQSTNQPHVLLKLRGEVIVLKQLDLDMKAKNHLLKTLLKAKRIRESAVFLKLYGPQPKIEHVKQGPEADVQARLFQSNPAKEAMSGFMDRIYNILGIDRSSKETQMSKAAPSQSNGQKAQGDRLETPTGHDNTDADEANDSKFDHADDDSALDAYQHHLASSDEGEDSDLEDDLASSDVSDPPTPPPTRRKAPPPTGASSFLPTLGATGYYSGSESASDIDGNDAGVQGAKPRKNRRGQTARRQIAEKKYGREAKHVQNGGQRSGGSRNPGWDAQRGAVDPDGHRGGRSGRGRAAGRGGHGNVEDGRSQSKPEEKPVAKTATGTSHPSWQAAKQRKQQINPGAAFTGTKISFD